MADKKISELTALVSGSVATNDLFVIVDTDANETKKITVSDLTTVVGGTPYTDADVDTHLNTGTAGSGEILSWNGSDYDWIAAGGMVYPGAGIAVSTGSAWGTSLTAPTGTIVGTSDTQTLTNKTLTDPAIIGTVLEDVYTITDGAAFEVDPSNGSIQLITLGASRTPKATNFAAGESITLMVDDGTAYTLTWTDATWGSSGVVWETDGGTAPTLATSGYTTIVFWKVGSQIYGARVGDA